jgi:hypothetical protein
MSRLAPVRLPAVVALLFAVTSAILAAGLPSSVAASSATVKSRLAPREPQLAELKGSDTVAGNWFGSSVAMSGMTAVVGEWRHDDWAGRACVFTETATGWKQTAELKGSNTVKGDSFGISVAMSGMTAVVGAPNNTDGGRAYVFTKTGTGWRQVAELRGSDATGYSFFGSSVAISGATVVIGANNKTDGGRAYVFTKAATGWKQTAELKGSDTAKNDGFGWSVAISGTTVVVTAVWHGHGLGAAAYVFTKTANGWTQVAELKGSDRADEFGFSAAVSGTTAIVGAVSETNGAGSAYVFGKTSTGWTQVAELKGSNTADGNGFGSSVAIAGTVAVVGSPPIQAKGAGAAYVFVKTETGWRRFAELKGSDTVAGDNFGFSVAISAGVVVGAPGHAKSAGRAYVFDGPGIMAHLSAGPGIMTY